MTHAEHLANYGDLAICGNPVAAFIAPRSAIAACPCGWMFLALEDLMPEGVRETLDTAQRGRTNCPDGTNHDLDLEP